MRKHFTTGGKTWTTRKLPTIMMKMWIKVMKLLKLCSALFVIVLQTTVNAQENNTDTTKLMCVKHFNRAISKCMSPFNMESTKYRGNSRQEKRDISVKHLCHEYKKTLQCVHLSLTSCPSLKNIQRVQQKLGTNWVVEVNDLCISRTNGSNTTQMEHRNNKVHNINSQVHKSKSDEQEITLSNELPQVVNENIWKPVHVSRENKQRHSKSFSKFVRYDFHRIPNNANMRSAKLTIYDQASSCGTLSINALVTLTFIIGIYFSSLY